MPNLMTDPFGELDQRLNKLLEITDNPSRVIMHYARIGEFVQSIYDNGQILGDVTITFKGSKAKFFVHKLVLACHSKYFHNIFSRDTFRQEVTLGTEISPELFEICLRYFYSGILDGNKNKQPKMLEIAQQLQAYPLTNKLIERIDVSCKNCLSVIDLSRRFHLKALRQEASRILTKDFLKVSLSKEFLNLNADLLSEIISKPDVFVRCEKDIFDAVARWVYYDEAKRIPVAHELLCNVNFHHMSTSELRKCLEEAPEIFRPQSPSLNAIHEALLEAKRRKSKGEVLPHEITVKDTTMEIAKKLKPVRRRSLYTLEIEMPPTPT